MWHRKRKSGGGQLAINRDELLKRQVGLEELNDKLVSVANRMLKAANDVRGLTDTVRPHYSHTDWEIHPYPFTSDGVPSQALLNEIRCAMREVAQDRYNKLSPADRVYYLMVEA